MPTFICPYCNQIQNFSSKIEDICFCDVCNCIFRFREGRHISTAILINYEEVLYQFFIDFKKKRTCLFGPENHKFEQELTERIGEHTTFFIKIKEFPGLDGIAPQNALNKLKMILLFS